MTHEHWSNYWHSGMQTSLPHDFKHNYDREILSYWQQVFNQFPDGSRVLDICTGNGAVALIVAEFAKKNNINYKISAVDISQINTAYIYQHNPKQYTDMIEFISGQPAETIDKVIHHSQDIVVSQFGLEYSDLSVSAKALANVMKPKARLVFIAHSATSDVFKYMSKEELIYEWLDSTGLFDLFENFGESVIGSQELVDNLFQIIANNQPKPDFQSQSLFQSWLQLIAGIRQSNQQQLTAQQNSVLRFVQEHQAARKRQQDMINVAHKISQTEWIQPILDAGFELITKQDLKYNSKYDIGKIYDFRLI